MQAGLSGALIVVDSPEAHDPEHDIVLLMTAPRKNEHRDVVLLNGSAKPPAREMRVGQHYRLRLINVHTFRPNMRMRLRSNAGDGSDSTLRWRPVAKDGMDLPSDQRIERAAEIQMGNGETYDFDFVPSNPGDFQFEVSARTGIVLVSMPFRVR